MGNPDRAPENIPTRDRMSPKNQNLFEEFQEMARPLHEKIAKQVEEMNVIIRQKWDLEAERDGIKQRALTTINGLKADNISLRDALATVAAERERLRQFEVTANQSYAALAKKTNGYAMRIDALTAERDALQRDLDANMATTTEMLARLQGVIDELRRTR